jgi:hypothetical protein
MSGIGIPGDPVFVLCNGRSGSTLLRFLLDAHPDLACPPETNLPAMAGQLATVWSLIEGARLSPERGDEPPEVPEAAIAGVRRTMDELTGGYLARRGKKRYCDKSLGAARFAALLARIYPGAQFLCLYRHPMDVIASGIEACPWGLNGYGFDPYIAGTPGNSVLALARFWTENVSMVLAVEEQFPASCHRIRYEDLVADPEAEAAGIFDFLGVSQQPGITAVCFAAEPERSGPADYKIWHTSEISAASVGRGWSVPTALLPPPAAQQLNELAGKLGYVPVDDSWGTAAVPADLRMQSRDEPGTGTVAVVGAEAGRGEAVRRRGETASTAQDLVLRPAPPAALAVGERFAAAVASLGPQFSRRWQAASAETFGILVTAAATPLAGHCRWRVDLDSRTVTADPDPARETSWDMVGSIDAWLAVLNGQANLGVALRRCDLRYCDAGEAGPAAADARVNMLEDLLGLAGSRRDGIVPRPELDLAEAVVAP